MRRVAARARQRHGISRNLINNLGRQVRGRRARQGYGRRRCTRNTVGGAEHFKLLQDQNSGFPHCHDAGGYHGQRACARVVIVRKHQLSSFLGLLSCDRGAGRFDGTQRQTHRRGASRQCRPDSCRKRTPNKRSYIRNRYAAAGFRSGRRAELQGQIAKAA
jgi:hypothetical protein